MTGPAEFGPMEPLPGLGDPPTDDLSRLEAAARRTLKALDDLGLLEERHALQCELLLAQARGYETSVRAAGGKVTVAASATAAQLQSLLDSLPVPEGGGESDPWAELVEQFKRLERGGPPVRDPQDTGAGD